jgi:polysaccharide chain length determinant protein (PEP-CTERM system associated)
MQAMQESRGFQGVLEVWRRRKWLAFLVFTGVYTAAMSVAAFLPDIYRSTATILIERQKVPEAFVQSTVTGGIDNRLQIITQQILGRERLESLIKRFGLYADMRQRVPLEQVVERMRQDINLEQKGQQQNKGADGPTIAFTIGYRGPHPQVVAQVTNILASFYIEENLKVREQQAAGTVEFLRGQLEGVRQGLEEQEQRLSQFKERYMGELPEQLQTNLAILERLSIQLRLHTEKQARVGVHRTILAKQLAEADGFGPAGEPKAGTPGATAAELERLQQELRVLLTRFTDKHPNIIRKKGEIALLEQRHTEAERGKKPAPVVTRSVNPYVQQLQKELGELEAESKALRTEEDNLLSSITLYQQRVENTPRREQEIQGLLRDYESTQGLYQSLLKRQEEARLAESMEHRQKGEQFRLLDLAIPSQRPAEPDRRKLTLAGLLLSLGLAASAMVLAEKLDTSFHTVDDLRAFSQVPVLVNLPRIVTKAEVLQRRWRFGLATISAIMGLVLIVGSSYAAIQGKAHLASLLTQAQLLLR